MCMRNNNLPDGCNRMDTSYPELDGYDVYSSHEEYVLSNCFFETITKENFTRIMADEIKDVELKEGEVEFLLQKDRGDKMEIKIEAQIVHKPKVPVDEIIDWCINDKHMTCIGCGKCETVIAFTPDGALSGEKIDVFDIEDVNLLKRFENERKAQAGEISWWEIFSTQQQVDVAVARMRRAHRTKIVKIEMDVVIN